MLIKVDVQKKTKLGTFSLFLFCIQSTKDAQGISESIFVSPVEKINKQVAAIASRHINTISQTKGKTIK